MLSLGNIKSASPSSIFLRRADRHWQIGGLQSRADALQVLTSRGPRKGPRRQAARTRRDFGTMALLIASNSRAEEFAAMVRELDPGLDVRIAPALGKPRGDRHGARLVAAAGPAQDAAEPAPHRLGRRRRRSPLQRPRPARRADRALRRSRPHGPHGRIRRAARALSPSPHERVPRAAGAQGLEIRARARGARGSRRRDGTGRARRCLRQRAQGVRLPGARLEPGARNRFPASPASPASPSSMPSSPTPTSSPCCCRSRATRAGSSTARC